MTTICRLQLATVLFSLGFSIAAQSPAEQMAPDSVSLARVPRLGLPPLPSPPEEAEIRLGARLFFDTLLSTDGSVSCSTCHLPEQAFTQNGSATATGLDGRPLRRNAPTLLNVAYRQRLFHDGREDNLAGQAISPLLASNEMGNPSLAAVVARLDSAAAYQSAFRATYDSGLNEENLGRALAAFQQTLVSADSPFDRWFYGGDSEAMSSQAKAGFFVFSAVGCGDCHKFGHAQAQFTDDALHRTGVNGPDKGREEVTGQPKDRHRFRTPTLRNVALTAPYMHDGRLPNLMDVVDFYDRGGGNGQDRKPLMTPLGLNGEQKHLLIAFLESLTGSSVGSLAEAARLAAVRPVRPDVHRDEGDG